MPSDFAVAVVRPRAANRLEVETSVPGEAVEAVDFGDGLNPRCWILTPSGGPSVARVDTLTPGTDSTALWSLVLDAALAAGPYSLALAPLTRSRYGQPTDVTPLLFVMPAALPIVAGPTQVQGADLATPVQPDGTGDLLLLTRLEALHDRLNRLLSVQPGAFKDVPQYAVTVQAKRSYSQYALQQEALRLKGIVLNDSDVQAARVSYNVAIRGLLAFDVEVVPKFAPKKKLNLHVTAGGGP